MHSMNSHDIRKSLIERATAYARVADTSLSAIGVAAVNDSKFLKRIADGKNFNIKTYQEVVDWLDKSEKTLAKPRRKTADRVSA